MILRDLDLASDRESEKRNDTYDYSLMCIVHILSLLLHSRVLSLSLSLGCCCCCGCMETCRGIFIALRYRPRLLPACLLVANGRIETDNMSINFQFLL
jgi:hypothetical protein